MQSKKREIDNSYRVKSLDNHFYVDSFNTITKKAISDHTPKSDDEIELRKGDIISSLVKESPIYQAFSANLWNGYMKGTNLRTMKTGIFPTYKVIEFYIRI